MHQNGQVTAELPDLNNKKLFTLCWRVVSESGRDSIAFSFAFKGSLYVIYEFLWPIAMQSNHDAKPNIGDAPLALILPQAYVQYRTIQFGIVYQ